MLKFRNAMAMHHWTRLGRCPACMRTAFLFALGSFLVAAIASTPIVPMGTPRVAIWLIAAGFVALWMGHVLMFSRYATQALAVSRSGKTMVDTSRRAAIFAFLGLLIVTATVTSLPKTLRAQSCNCFSDTDCYCPPDFPQCIFNPSTSESICCGPDTVGCAGPNLTWCCPPGSNCYGNDGQCYGNN